MVAFERLRERLPVALRQAALTADLESVRTSYGALSVNTPQQRDETLMGIAECAAIKTNPKLLEWCFEAGFRMSPDLTNTSLYNTARDSRSTAIWGVLLRHGLDLNVTYCEANGDVFSETVREGDVELARFLLDNGQDPNAARGSDYYGYWDIGSCAVLGEQPFRAVEILDQMLKHGWVQHGWVEKANGAKERVTSAAHVVAAKVGHMDALRLLVENGADLEFADNWMDWGHEEVDPSMEWYRNVTALFAAAHNGHEEAVGYLLKKGANASFKDPRGLTCLWAARQSGNEKIVKMVEAAGATE